MLFDKHRNPRCEYCRHGTRLDAEGRVICLKHGVSEPDDSCARFVYDPVKRQTDPPARYRPRTYREEDFEL